MGAGGGLVYFVKAESEAVTAGGVVCQGADGAYV